MAAPTATARATPTGIMLQEGFRALVTFYALPEASLWEIETTPFGVSNGDPIELATQHSVDFIPKAPRALNEVTDGSFTCGYDPVFKTQLLNLVGKKTTITVTYPDGTTEAHYGYMSEFTADGMSHGNMPTATVNFVSTMWDHTNRVQAPYTVTNVAGT